MKRRRVMLVDLAVLNEVRSFPDRRHVQLSIAENQAEIAA